VRRALALVLLWFGAAHAEPVTTSPLPQPRPSDDAAETRMVVVPVQFEANTRPRPRPGGPTERQLQPAISAGSGLAAAQVPARGLRAAPRPRARPDIALARPARPLSAEPARVLRSGRIGAVCGVSDLIGRQVDPIPGRLGGCGIANPVRISEVAGVRLSRSATMDCTTAKALHAWVERGVKPVVGRTGGGVAQLEVAAGYACRTINSRPGGSISEHGKGKAIDISGITFRNGQTVTLLEGWRRPGEGEILRRLHRAACGPFGTVLGPEADRFHQDHFHFDTKARRQPYCR